MGCLIEFVYEFVLEVVGEACVEFLSEYLPEKMNKKIKTLIKVIVLILSLIPLVGLLIGIGIMVQNKSEIGKGITIVLISISIGILEFIIAVLIGMSRDKKIKKTLEDQKKDNLN